MQHSNNYELWAFWTSCQTKFYFASLLDVLESLLGKIWWKMLKDLLVLCNVKIDLIKN